MKKGPKWATHLKVTSLGGKHQEGIGPGNNSIKLFYP